MIPGSRRVVPTSPPSNREIRVLPHYLLVNLHLRTRISTVVKILDLNLHIHRVVWSKVVVSLLPAPSLIKTTLVFVVSAPLVVSSVVNRAFI